MGRLEGLSRHAGAELWVKRDDRASAVYGGSKVRKLEFVLARPGLLEAGCIASAGAAGSHHLLALALHLERLGRRPCSVVVPQAAGPGVLANLAVIASLSERLIPCPSRVAVPLALALHLARHRDGGRARAALVEPGATAPDGMAGMVLAGLELAEQVHEGLLPAPGTVVVAGGTGGVAAGLALGLGHGGLVCRLRVAAAVERWALGRTRLSWLVARAARAVGMDRDAARRVEVVLDRGALGPGYGAANAESRLALDLARDLDGLDLETTYTAKALAALLAHAGSDPQPILLWNTHGGPAPGDRAIPGWERRLGGALGPLLRTATAVKV
ncbi:MAG: pyridoxal-phosphate dependent enzyme [Planctomycetes bacterium]|nr:pyridoxal-phosphate dependent enzyme [Planctomycetota bacterium]